MTKIFLLWILLISMCIIGSSMKLAKQQRKSTKSSLKNKTVATTLRRRKSPMIVRFLVCTRKHKKCIRYGPNDKASIIDRYKMTKVLIHGWQNDENSEMPQTLKSAYLKHQDVNVIIVGWGKYSKTLDYSYSVGVKAKLANCVMQFLLRNIRTENPELAIHMIGHSLGAHVCGYVGVLLGRRNFIPYRISGLDPASPLIVKGLQPTDAFFVDIIHTSAGTLGQWAPAGHIDFYPNGGMMPQPLCSILKPQCSHSFAWKFFAYTIKNGSRYRARRCSSYTDYLIGYCDEPEYMGEAVSVYGRGKYYVDTMA